MIRAAVERRAVRSSERTFLPFYNHIHCRLIEGTYPYYVFRPLSLTGYGLITKTHRPLFTVCTFASRSRRCCNRLHSSTRTRSPNTVSSVRRAPVVLRRTASDAAKSRGPEPTHRVSHSTCVALLRHLNRRRSSAILSSATTRRMPTDDDHAEDCQEFEREFNPIYTLAQEIDTHARRLPYYVRRHDATDRARSVEQHRRDASDVASCRDGFFDSP
jgi:hypothetical protein